MTLATVRSWLTETWQRIWRFIVKYPWLVPVIIILIFYWRLPNTYFEQDEWQAFETYITHQNQSFVDCFAVQRPLTCVVNTLEWRVFGLNAAAYGYFSLLLIISISLLFYRFLRHWPLPEYKRVLVAALFPLMAAGAQAITWFGAFSASLPSFLFAVLALDFLVLDLKHTAWKWRIGALLAMLASLYFKEESLWLVPVSVIIWWTYSVVIKEKLTRKSFIRHLGPMIAAILLYLFFEHLRQSHSLVFGSLVSTTDSHRYYNDVFKSLFLLPLSHLSHVLLAPENIIFISVTNGFPIGVLSYWLSALLLLIFALILRYNQREDRPFLIAMLVWAATAFVSYAIFGKNPEFLEGRYYFGAQAPVMALLVVGLLPNKINGYKAFNTLSFGLFGVILAFNIVTGQQRLIHNVAIAGERSHILSYIQQHTGPLPDRAIIYTETTNYGYAGQAANILPFQNGLGTTFRVIYQGKNQDYRLLAPKQQYLWNLLEQGYDEVNGVGFGYFRDYEKMANFVKHNNFPINNIYAFRYQGKDISDITSLMRGRLTIEQHELVPVNKDAWNATSSNDKGVDERHGIEKVLDGDPKSDWATPHRAGEYLEVDFGKPIDNVAEVVLRTADGNSFPRIFTFSYSPNGTDWKVDFTDSGHLADNINTPIIFGPKTIRKYRVTIIDPRPTIFAWSVSDLSAFTVKE